MNRACFTNTNLHESNHLRAACLPDRRASGLFKTNYPPVVGQVFRMKELRTILLLMIGFIIFSCTKKESLTNNLNNNMKCVVGCLPEGFDYKMVINSGDTLSGTFFDQVWGHEFKGNPGDQLTIIVTAKNKIASLFVTVYQNDTMIYEKHCINTGDFPRIILRDTVGN